MTETNFHPVANKMCSVNGLKLIRPIARPAISANSFSVFALPDSLLFPATVLYSVYYERLLFRRIGCFGRASSRQSPFALHARIDVGNR